MDDETVSSDMKCVEDFYDKVRTTTRKRTQHVCRSRYTDYQRNRSDVEDRHRRRRGNRGCSRSGDRSRSRSRDRSRGRSGDKHKEVFHSLSDKMECKTTNTNHVKGENHRNSKLESSSLNRDQDEIRQRGDRHWVQKSLHEMTQGDWLILKSDHNIVCKGESIPHPLRSWDDLTVPSFIKEVIDKSGYTNPTPIQMQTIPIVLQSRDVIGVAGAGSGKTVAYLVPLFAWIHGLPKCEKMENTTKTPDAVILTPTRLVAQQVKEECDKFGEVSGIRTTTVIGGVNFKEQTRRLGSGCDILVATPGRLLDVLEKGILVLNQGTCVVMDEFDVMIEFGFEPDLRKILDILPQTSETEGAEKGAKNCHQTVMFTSTMPLTVERLTRTFLYDPCMVQHCVYKVTERQKDERLLEILRERLETSVIIFIGKKNGVEEENTHLSRMGSSAAAVLPKKVQDAERCLFGGF